MTASPHRAGAGLRVVLGALLLLTPALTALAGKPAPIPAEVTAALQDAPADRAAAIAALEAALARASGAERTWLLLQLGEQRRLTGDTAGALEAFDSVVDSDEPSLAEPARVGRWLVLAETGASAPEVVAGLTDAADRNLPRSQQADREAWLALQTAGTPEADKHARKALGLSEEAPDQHARIEARLLVLDVGGDPLDAARDALARGDRDAARRLSSRALNGATSDDVRTRAQRLLHAADGAEVKGRIGVLLPLTGRFGAVGTQVRDALDLGWKAAGRTDALVYVDTQGDPTTAVRGLEELVDKHGVIGVIGPLLSPETDAVVHAADDLGVPLLVMSQALSDPTPYPWVFQTWVTPAAQVEALVRHAVDVDHWTRFVVLAPDNDYGRLAADTFTASVQAHGGTIVLADTYAPDATDFRPVAQRIARRPGTDKPPVVDYDAIFLPDSARRVSLVAAGLAFEEIPVGTFKPHDDGPVKLLGLSGWDNHELLAGGGSYTQGGLFTDVFVPPPETNYRWYVQPGWQEFVDGFRAATSRTPTPVEALAADTARIAARALAGSPTHRDAYREALLAASVTVSPTGATAFDPQTRTLRRRIRVLSVRKDGFEPVDGD